MFHPTPSQDFLPVKLSLKRTLTHPGHVGLENDHNLVHVRRPDSNICTSLGCSHVLRRDEWIGSMVQTQKCTLGPFHYNIASTGQCLVDLIDSVLDVRTELRLLSS